MYEQQSTSGRKEYLCLLSVISAISVVFLHTNGCFWHFSSDKPYWFWANITECIFYFAVPIFFMITGITLIDYKKKYSTKTFFLKRINKTVIPFIFWSIIAILHCIFYTKSITLSELSLTTIFNGIWNTKFMDIYWFFIPLFFIYMTIPLLSYIEEKNRDKIFMYIILLMFLFNSFIPLVIKIFNLKIEITQHFALGCDSIIYPILGYLLDKYYKKIISNKNLIIGIYTLAVTGLLIHMIGTYNLSMQAGEIIKTFKGYDNVPCIFYSIGIFIFLRQTENFLMNNKVIKCIILFLCNYTFAIYLLHKFILDYMHANMETALNRLGLPFGIIPICIIVTFLIRKIKFGNRILP